jgi:sarcosine oxidase delta subunit
MTPTRTLSAVLVWLRANERISVSDFGTWAHLHQGCKLQFHIRRGANSDSFGSYRFATERQIRPAFKLPLLWQARSSPR